ncbi:MULTISPECIES: VUT family protein [unclassified Amycolatopsis]|uniref:VUT family protein n=1 Tax=unclassified Amycolatopsis TaxID=2618356 RepID=UPI00287525F9|nr:MULTISPECIES: VUT family protein [unclassified Amycolatopsis]MDS0140594.1 VUT family protein [Amycolatopsis sp. 505]MDS0149244.1 VUT family protein [Amycolatopsis sp. CM201R]
MPDLHPADDQPAVIAAAATATSAEVMQVGSPRPRRRASKLALLLAYVASIVIGNLATSYLGLAPAGFGLMVTAGTYASGLALSFRDHLQDAAGVRWVVAGIAAGIAVSAIGGDLRIALASAAAFAVGEAADLVVYTPLRRRRGFRPALIASNTAGGIVDTCLFLVIAGFPLSTDVVAGQLLVKAVWTTGLYLLVQEAARRALPRKRQLTEGA